jgi:polyhydroxybutyrate depolymerase
LFETCAACFVSEPRYHEFALSAGCTASVHNPTMRVVAALAAVLLIGCSGSPPAQAPAPDKAQDVQAAPTNVPPSVPTPAPQPPSCTAPHVPGDFVESMTTVDGERSLRIHVPDGYGGAVPVPLVLNFHGSSRSGLHQETYSGFVPLSDREGFVLVSPEAAGFGEWDIIGLWADIGVDDLGFTAALLDYLAASLCIDPARVYATGMSNGAQMASQAACYFPGRFAAIAPVAGVAYQGCEGASVPVIAFHGTEDYNVPFEETPPAMQAWAEHNGCSPDLATEEVSEHVTRQSYSGCGGADVVLYVVHGGGHTWPGADEATGGVGFTTHEIDASELIWQFFASHPRR